MPKRKRDGVDTEKTTKRNNKKKMKLKEKRSMDCTSAPATSDEGSSVVHGASVLDGMNVKMDEMNQRFEQRFEQQHAMYQRFEQRFEQQHAMLNKFIKDSVIYPKDSFLFPKSTSFRGSTTSARSSIGSQRLSGLMSATPPESFCNSTGFRKIASSRITKKEICEHSMITLSREKIKDTYTLDQLFECCNFDLSKAPKKYYNVVNGRSYKEYPVSIWITDLIETAGFISDKFEHVAPTVGMGVNFDQVLSPLLTSLDIRPDTSLRIVVNQYALPIFMSEMHSGSCSSSYDNTVWKSASNSIDQFRVLKMFKPELKKVTSFVFPNPYIRTKVSKVEVTFSVQELQFVVKIEELLCKDVKEEVLRVLSDIQALLNFELEIRHHYFLRFSDEELAEFSTIVEAKKPVEQAKSSYSLVFTDGTDYWKRVTEFNDFASVGLQIGLHKKNKHIQELEFLPRQLVKSRALLVQIALSSFHSNGYAHLDIRMPNVCFTLDGTMKKHIAVLIDLDKAKKAKSNVTNYYKDTKDDCVADQLDWIQLGIMAKRVMYKTVGEFVSSLIEQGRWLQQSFEESTEFNEYSMDTVDAILAKRNLQV